MSRAKVVLLDQPGAELDTIRSFIEPESEIVCMCDSGGSFPQNITKLRPDVVVLDINSPETNSISAAEHVRDLLPKIKLIFLTDSNDLETAVKAFKLGAAGYVLKSAAETDLGFAIREAVRGGFYASPALKEGMIGSFVRSFGPSKRSHNLSPRQREVLKLLAKGNSMREIGEALGITPRTVAFHKYTMMRQLKIKSNAELINFVLTNIR